MEPLVIHAVNINIVRIVDRSVHTGWPRSYIPELDGEGGLEDKVETEDSSSEDSSEDEEIPVLLADISDPTDIFDNAKN